MWDEKLPRNLSFKTRKLENGPFNEQRFKRCGMKNHQKRVWFYNVLYIYINIRNIGKNRVYGFAMFKK